MNNKWVDILKELKKKQVNLSADPNIPVTIYAERDDKYVVASISMSKETPEPKYEGLHAAATLKAAIDPDLVIFISDSYYADSKEFKGMSLAEEFRKGNKNVKEALVCVSINRNKEMFLITLPYYYGGGNIIIWDEEQTTKPNEGLIPDSLIKIMNQPLISKHSLLENFNLAPEDEIASLFKAAVKLLESKGFTIVNHFN